MQKEGEALACFGVAAFGLILFFMASAFMMPVWVLSGLAIFILVSVAYGLICVVEAQEMMEDDDAPLP